MGDNEQLTYPEWRKYITNSISLSRWSKEALLDRIEKISINKKMKHRIKKYPEYLKIFLSELDTVYPIKKMTEQSYLPDISTNKVWTPPVTSSTEIHTAFRKGDKIYRGPNTQSKVDMVPTPKELDFSLMKIFESMSFPIFSLIIGLAIGYFGMYIIKKSILQDNPVSKLKEIGTYIKDMKKIFEGTEQNLKPEL